MGTPPLRIFISYSHDSDEHRHRVLALSDGLNKSGLNCDIDQYINGSPEEGWPLWMERMLETASYVLVICTETYLNRVQRKEKQGIGKGVKWESLLTYQDIYDNDGLNRKFIPVVFTADDTVFIPKPLRAVSHYNLSIEGSYEKLLRHLTGQPVAVKPQPGQVPSLAPINHFPPLSPDTLADIHHRVFLANSSHQLNQVRYELEQYMADYPHSPDALMLLDRLKIAIEKEDERNRLPSSAPLKSAHISWWSVILLVLAIVMGLIFYWLSQKTTPIGETLLQQGEYQQAQQECQAAPASTARERCLRITSLMLEPRDVETFYAAANPEDSAYALAVMGEAEASREDFSNAEKHYQDAIQRNPAVAQAYFGMGQIRQMQNRAAEALDWYKQAVDYAPNNRRFQLNLASTYVEQGQLPAAEQHYRKVLSLDNSTLLAYAELVDVLLKQQKTVEARALAHHAQQGLANNPDWKNSPLNQDVWLVMQDGNPAYLESWEDKQAYLLAQFQKAGFVSENK
ncbi:TIR domain-containing protein [Thiothrix unzii]|uniref:TIR domain-containing protein n=1 Tax=Thiothrix unzii TaxID=111769 RepID=A0A975FCB3_9GAMM|nr:TIR domain-containing protein [Thiothrix unzii]